MIGTIRKFIFEVISELKKVSWSSRKEVIEATKVVLVSGVLLGVFIAGVDFVLLNFVNFLMK